MRTLKKIYSKNNNEIVLISSENSEVVGLENPTYADKLQPKTILTIGVFHGDEPQGKFLVKNYIQSLQAERSNPKNRLLFIPCLNPDGLANNTRQNANMVDLNRNFPTKNWTKSKDKEYFGGENPSSEVETRFIEEIIEEFSPNIILTLHAPYKVVNYDGPAEEIAKNISKIIGYPVQNDIGYPTPGSFGTYSGVEKNIPTITLELDEEIDVNKLVKPMDEIFDYLSNC